MKNKNRLTPFGRCVVKALTDRDMSKMELAAAVGISQPYLSYILYGHRSGKKYLSRIAAVLEIDKEIVKRLTA